MLKFIQNNREATALLAVLLLFVLPGMLDSQYLSVQTLTMIFSSSQILMLLAMGSTLVMLTRNIDVSVGSITGMCAVLLGLLLNAGYPLPVACVATLLLGLLAGFINGVLVAWLKIPAIVATLGTLGLYRGVMLLWTGGKWIEGLPAQLKQLSAPVFLGISAIGWLTLLLMLLMAWLLAKTAFGRCFYATGDNLQGARQLGVRTEAIRILAAQRFQNERNKGFPAYVGFSRWKRPHARAFLQSTTGTIRFFSDWWKAIKWAQANGGDVVVWASKCTIGLESSCQTMGVRLIRMEDGFIRSVGLGSDFNWPYSLVLDEKGIYYDPSRPSGLEDILNTLPEHPERAELCSRASALRGFIVEKGITKYNTGVDAVTRGDFSAKGRLLLVPGQVEDDASVRLGGCGLFSNVDLLKAVRERHPDAFIIYKPHPDVESRNRKGRIPDEEALRYADRVVRNVRMDVLLGIVDEVHTLTSLTGFEALLRGIEVHAYGGPFYAGWGLTHDRIDFPRRKAGLSLEELIAGTLILYPSYYDWQTKGFCTPEDICYRLTQPKGQMRGKFFMRTFAALREKIRNVF